MKRVYSKPIVIRYTCDFCGREFGARKRKTGERLCQNCIELRRLIRRWAKEGIWVREE